MNRVSAAFFFLILLSQHMTAQAGTLAFDGRNFTYTDTQFSEEKVTKFVEVLRSLGELPNSTVTYPLEPEQIDTHQALDDEIKAIFLRYEKFYFGRNGVIQLGTCEKCEALNVAQTSKVLINPRFLEKIRQRYPVEKTVQVLNFLMAHELAHSVVDMHEALHGSTIHGYSNLNFPWSESMTMDDTVPFLFKMARAHSEVDFIAMVALKMELGVTPGTQDLIKEFLNEDYGEVYDTPVMRFAHVAEIQIRSENLLKFR